MSKVRVVGVETLSRSRQDEGPILLKILLQLFHHMFTHTAFNVFAN